MIGEIWRKATFFFHRRRFEKDLEEEMRLHAEMAGRPRFGNMTLLKEASRGEWGFGPFDRFAQDLRFAYRMLRKSPAFTLAAVLSLALGIGANTAIFSVIYAVLLRSLPVRNPEQLKILVRSDLQRTGLTSLPYPFYRELRDRGDLFSGLICQANMSPSFSVHGSAERVTGELVSANYFDVLGLKPYAGRFFRSDEETAAGANRVVVLSYGFWRQRFAGNPAVIGTVIDLNTTPMTIVGVSPPEFDGLQPGFSPDVRVPITMQPQMYLSESMIASSGDWWLDIVGRLKPGVSTEHANAALTAFLQSFDRNTYGKSISKFNEQVVKSERMNLLPGGTGLVTGVKKAAKELYVLMAVVVLVLLGTCLNLANLLLARTAARRREIAVRLSLGAARRRLVRQLLTESLLLAVTGGALGLILAFWGTRLLVAFLLAGETGAFMDATPDMNVLAFTIGLSLVTGLFFGLAPALRSTRLELTPELKGETARVPGTKVAWPKALVSLQVALSLILLIGAGLFLRSLVRLRTMDTGFDKNNVLEVSMDPTLTGYTQQQAQVFYRKLQDRVSRLPGVESVSFSSIGLVSGSGWGSGIEVPGYQPKDGDPGPDRNVVGPTYFGTLRIPMIRGRDFGLQDNANSSRVAIVNETFARFYFGRENPIGRHIGQGNGEHRADFAIVGVAKDGKYAGLREKTPRFWYIPYEQYDKKGVHGLTMYVRTRTNEPLKQTNAIRQAVRAIDPNVPIFNFKTLEQQIDDDLATDRMVATLSTFFSLVTVFISAIGLYGVMTYAVTKRTREIGIRMALGAQRTTVIGSMMGEVCALVAIGLACGLLFAMGLGKFLATLLFEIKPHDRTAFIAATALATVVTLIAGYLPARRAASIDPTIALRYE